MPVRLINLTIDTEENNGDFLLLMLHQQVSKKALILSAFFVSSLIGFLPLQTFAESCISKSLSAPEHATVKWVYDGDTLLLTDKRKIRIIGIDTPEVKHHQQKAQAYGAKAREALRELLNEYDYKVILRYEKERLDKYSRILAHVYTLDGINISSWLLENGFARTMSIPPNVDLADCYKKSETIAQDQSLKIWRLKSHNIKPAETLGRRIKGYVRLKGKINKIIKHKKTLVMELDSTTKSHIQIKIKKSNLQYFKLLDPDKLWGKSVEIAGILKNRRNKRTIYLDHPSQINVLKRKKRVAPVIKWSLQK